MKSEAEDETVTNSLSDVSRHQVALGTLFLLPVVMAALLGLHQMLGAHGLGAGLYAFAAVWCWISWSGTRGFRPLSDRPMNRVEVCTLFIICGILHGLALPAVSSKQHRRVTAPPPAAVPPAAVPSSAAASISPAGKLDSETAADNERDWVLREDETGEVFATSRVRE